MFCPWELLPLLVMQESLGCVACSSGTGRGSGRGSGSESCSTCVIHVVVPTPWGSSKRRACGLTGVEEGPTRRETRWAWLADAGVRQWLHVSICVHRLIHTHMFVRVSSCLSAIHVGAFVTQRAKTCPCRNISVTWRCILRDSGSGSGSSPWDVLHVVAAQVEVVVVVVEVTGKSGVNR